MSLGSTSRSWSLISWPEKVDARICRGRDHVLCAGGALVWRLSVHHQMIQSRLPRWPDHDRIPPVPDYYRMRAEEKPHMAPDIKGTDQFDFRDWLGQPHHYTGAEHHHIQVGCCIGRGHGWYERRDGGSECPRCEQEKANG